MESVAGASYLGHSLQNDIAEHAEANMGSVNPIKIEADGRRRALKSQGASRKRVDARRQHHGPPPLARHASEESVVLMGFQQAMDRQGMLIDDSSGIRTGEVPKKKHN